VATDVTSADAPPRDAAPASERAPASRPHQLRLGFIYGGLAIILVGAIAGVVVFAGRTIHPGTAWSSWKPKGGGQGAAQEIAAHVGAGYRLPNGDQLVDVISKAPAVSPPSSAAIPVHYIAVRGANGTQDRLYPVSPTNSVMYSLCGLGASCAIASGTPSLERGRLVRREILELALYTFKYVGGIQNVIAFIPPRPPAAGQQAKQYVVYLRHSDVESDLKRPLALTLGSKVPLPKAIPATEVRVIDMTTNPRVYTFNVTQAPQGDLVFMLAPFNK
jgi:hypothetical protein